jgi:two-component system nitrate/nitrite response regulator NarL
MSKYTGGNASSRMESRLVGLTERERQVVCLVARGLSNKEVGRQMNISEGTIKVHLHRIYQKLAIRNRTTLAALAAKEDLAAPGPLQVGAEGILSTVISDELA